MAGLIGASLLGLPAEASGKSRSKKQHSKSAKAAKSSSHKSSSRSPDYKSNYRKKDPPTNGGRPPRYKGERPPTGKTKRPPEKPPRGGGHYRPPIRPPERPVNPPRDDNPGYDPPIIYPPPVIIVDYPQYVYQPYYEEEPEFTAEDATLLFALGSMELNYVFIKDGQINEFAASVGIAFGVTTLVVASSSKAKHPGWGYLLGSAAIVFSVWNLAGGMDSVESYDDDPYYDEGYDSYYSTQPAGGTAGWVFSF